jgi:hypothetical protein
LNIFSFDSSDDDDSDSNKNEKIGPSNFICLALLGQGSFGEVYLVKKKIVITFMQ